MSEPREIQIGGDSYQIVAGAISALSGLNLELAKNEGDQPYTVNRTVYGVWSCTCPSFHFCRTHPKSCKHVRRIREILQDAVALGLIPE